jgi:hypothetical protein
MINDLNTLIMVNDEPKSADGIQLSKLSPHLGRPKGTLNLHAKHPSSIANRLKAAGIDWIASFGVAIKRNDKQLLTLWLRLLPYLIVTAGHRRVKRLKGRASKAALNALAALEQE